MNGLRNVLSALTALVLLFILTAPLSGDDLVRSGQAADAIVAFGETAEDGYEPGRTDASHFFVKPQAAETVVIDRGQEDIPSRTSSPFAMPSYGHSQHVQTVGLIGSAFVRLTLLCVFRL